VTEYIVDKEYPDSKLDKVLDHKLKPAQIKTIINHDADVYTKEGKLLLRVRKGKLKNEYIFTMLIAFLRSPSFPNRFSPHHPSSL
jgi:hypothetical protein